MYSYLYLNKQKKLYLNTIEITNIDKTVMLVENLYIKMQDFSEKIVHNI